MYNPFSEIKFLRWQVEELSKRVLELELGEKADKDACKTVHVATGACAGCKHYVAWTQRIGVKAYDHYACRLNKQCADREERGKATVQEDELVKAIKEAPLWIKGDDH